MNPINHAPNGKSHDRYPARGAETLILLPAIVPFANGKITHGHWAQAPDGSGFWSGEHRYTPRIAKKEPTAAEIASYVALAQAWIADGVRSEPNNRGVPPAASAPVEGKLGKIPESGARGGK